MRYMLLIYTNEGGQLTPERDQEVRAGHAAAMAEAAQRGFLRGAEPLFPSSSATTIRVKDGKRVITDGPFAETKEQLAGYYILECDNLDQALEIAAKVPTACGGGEGCIEVRPIQGLPTGVTVGADAVAADA